MDCKISAYVSTLVYILLQVGTASANSRAKRQYGGYGGYGGYGNYGGYGYGNNNQGNTRVSGNGDGFGRIGDFIICVNGGAKLGGCVLDSDPVCYGLGGVCVNGGCCTEPRSGPVSNKREIYPMPFGNRRPDERSSSISGVSTFSSRSGGGSSSTGLQIGQPDSAGQQQGAGLGFGGSDPFYSYPGYGK